MFEILVNKKNNQKEIALLENGKLVEYYIDEEEIRKEGNIYVGIVKDIVKGMQSAFVDIGAEKNSFIHLKDILDKVDESKEEIKNDVDISEAHDPRHGRDCPLAYGGKPRSDWEGRVHRRCLRQLL